MILEIFLPEYFRGKRLLTKKIVGFSIEDSLVRMIQLTVSSGKSTIHAIIEEPIAPVTTEAERLESTIKALAALALKMPKHDYIRIGVPTSLVLFKELKIPLKNRDKIQMVIGYEIESMLPFPLHESVFDFIITRNKPDEDFTHVLVAAIRKQDLQAILDTYERAGINPTQVTVDLLAFYGMYHAIPEYSSLKDGSALVDVSSVSTRVAFLQDGELRLIRTIPKGISTLINAIEQETKIENSTIKQYLVSQSIKAPSTNEVLNKAVQKHIISFLNDIQFTLNSFSLKLNFFKGIQKILCLNIEESIKGFCEFATDVLQTPCEPFSIQKLFSSKNIVSQIKPPLPWDSYTFLLGISLPPLPYLTIDLLNKTLKPIDKQLLFKQLIAAFLLVISVFGFIIINGIIQISTLNSRANQIERQEVSALKKALNEGKQNTRDDSLLRLIQKALSDSKLPLLVKKAKTIISEDERSWLAISHLKIEPLTVLYFLTQALDKKTFTLKINSTSLESSAQEGEKVSVTGFLKSKNEEHFQDYAKFKQNLSMDKNLLLIDSDEGLGEEEGVKFSLTFKQKDRVNA